MKKKININRPPINSEEIAKHKNFDSVLKQSNMMSKPFFKKPWFLSSVMVATVAIITSIFFITKEQTTDNKQLSTNKTDSLALAAFYKSEEAKPCISPPLKGIDIDFTSYKVDIEKGGTFDFKTGSKFIVPENAFVNEKGNPLKGEVELRYREFHDAVDFFVSGIPMTYDSAGTKYQFESAGMLEMQAMQDGKPVAMAKDKSIEIQLASNYKGTEYNLYKLDTLHNNWSCLGKDKVFESTKGKTVREYQKQDESPVLPEDNFNSDPLATKSYKEVVKETPEYKKIETEKVAVIKEKETAIAALPKPDVQPKKPKESINEKYTFDLNVDVKEFPELAIYKGILFQVGDENKDFNNSMYSVTWDDASIKEGPKKGENYFLTLKKGPKKYDLIVYPVFEGKNYDVAMKEYKDKLIEYKDILAKRKAEERRIEEQYQARIEAFKQQQEELLQEWKAKEANMFKQMTTQEKVMRTFSINSFGVYNSDACKSYPLGVLCNANLVKEKGASLMCYNIYLVDKGKNSLFTFYKNPLTQLSFNPESTNILWTVEDGVLYWLKPEEFSSLTGADGMKQIKMERVEKKFANADEIKAFFKI